MAYDESGFRQSDSDTANWSRTGARDDSPFDRDPPYRAESGGRHQSAGSPAADSPPASTADAGRRRSIPAAVLDDVFDDPAHGEPGRDRLGIHLGWEVVLLIGAVVVAILLYRANPDALGETGPDSLLVHAAALGLLALGAGLTLRFGAPNLALGPVAVASAVHLAENGDRGIVTAMAPAVVAVAALGLAVALVVVVFHVPAWAASLAGGLGVVAFIQQRSAPVTVQGDYDPSRSAGYLFAGFAAVALLGGLFGSIKAVRRLVGRFRPVADPARRRGGLAAVLVVLAITVSMVLALLAGVLLTGAKPNQVAPTPGWEWTGLALGAALLAGTSAFGRRGGIFGTLLSVVLLTLFITYTGERKWDISLYAIAAVAVAAGLLVTRLVEAFGRPRSAGEWPTESTGAAGNGGRRTGQADAAWSAERAKRPDPWPSALPTQPTDSPRDDPWGTGRWGQ